MAGEPWKEFLTETIETAGTGFYEIKLSCPPDGDKLFIGLAKGNIFNGNKRYRSNVTFPVELADNFLEAIEKMKKKAAEVKSE